MTQPRGVQDFAPFAVDLDPDKRRLRVVAVDLAILLKFLALDGTILAKVDGMPSGARVMMSRVMPTNGPNGKSSRFELLLWHPLFEPFTGPQPPYLEVNISWAKLERVEDEVVSIERPSEA